MAEYWRTRVQLPPPPPKTQKGRPLGWPFLVLVAVIADAGHGCRRRRAYLGAVDQPEAYKTQTVYASKNRAYKKKLDNLLRVSQILIESEVDVSIQKKLHLHHRYRGTSLGRHRGLNKPIWYGSQLPKIVKI